MFISTSENGLILEVKNLNLVYKIALQRNTNFRDVFTQFFRDPAEALFPQLNTLHVAKNISFSVKKGERVGILGVNGVGKTSLCRCISGMFTPTSGEIVRHVPVRGVFNTSLGIQPELTGRENAELLAHFIFPEIEDYNELIDEALDFSELGTFADVPYKLYSNGMQTRLCLSLVSARPAGLLILDEVFEGADVFFREKVSRRVTNVMKSSGAVIFVSHAPDQIRRVCTRTLVIQKGSVIFDGDVEEGISVYENLNQRPTAATVQEAVV